MKQALCLGLPLGLAAALLGCASLPARRTGTDAAREGWGALMTGATDGAEAAFARALAEDAEDAWALFGRATVAFERADGEVAWDTGMRLIERAAAGAGGWAPHLAIAAVARLEALLEESRDITAAEDRLFRLPAGALPWRARVALAERLLAAARRRGDERLYEREVGRAGCLRQATLDGTVGRLPHLDLAAAEAKGGRIERWPLTRVGCRLLVPALDGFPGVRLVRAVLTVPGGEEEIALGFTGPALLRIDGGSWHRHGSPAVYGPRWSVVRTTLSPGRHDLELRLGTYGGATEVTVMAGRALPTEELVPGDDTERALLALSGALGADLVGEVDVALGHAESLAGKRRFAVGLAVAARIAARDPTRPPHIGADAARAHYRAAIVVDRRMPRALHELAMLERLADRPREAIETAEEALRTAPRFWPAALTLAEALRARDLERDADQMLASTRGSLGQNAGACPVWEAALRRAQDLHQWQEETRLEEVLRRCDSHHEAVRDLLRRRGDLPAVAALLSRLLPTSADPHHLRSELARTRLAQDRPAEAAAMLRDLAREAPRDSSLRIRLANAEIAAGHVPRAKAVLAEAVRLFPTRSEVRAAARALAVPLPLDGFRTDGAGVIRAFARAERRYEAPAALVLDRTVVRVFPDGAQAILTHNIVRVQSKDGIERWGEIAVPEGAEVLTVRTHKPDGTVREPEEILGKTSLSAADLAVGDYLEWETMEFRDPEEAFAPGFRTDRFYFQSVEAPLDLSEFVVVLPPGKSFDQDRRAGAPTPTRETAPDGTQIIRFMARAVPQLFAEPAAGPALEWIPSVRVSRGVTVARWSRFLADEVHTVARTSPVLRRAAAEIIARAGDRAHWPQALVRWVNDRIEPEGGLLESATATLARRRGNRAALALALARTLGLEADLVFARSLAVAEASAPVVVQEIDDFDQPLVRLRLQDGTTRSYDPRLKRAPFGYLLPALNGAAVLVAGQARPLTLVSASPDLRRVSLRARLGSQGEAQVVVIEHLTGWPAIEWAEMLERAGPDPARLRQDFEQRWLSVHFPGAVLGALEPKVGDGRAEVRYEFTHPSFAAREGTQLKLAPGFFRAQPAQRYATEPRRRTPLLLGYDVPLELEARIQWPAGARVVEPGASVTVAVGGVSFAEQRQTVPGQRAPQVSLRRRWRLPLHKVAPAEYQALASALRRIDAAERGEVRVLLPAAD